jgi:phosphate butyryltransferase
MPLMSFDELYQRADALGRPLPIAVAGGADDTVLEALRVACDRGWVVPLVVGPEADSRRLAEAADIDLHGFSFIDAEAPAAVAVSLVRDQSARLLMKGQIATPALMKAILDPALGLRTGRVICQVVLLELRAARRRFLLADTGVCIQPSLREKIDILRSTVTLAHVLGEETPRVAALAASETTTPAMPETADAAELQRLGAAGEISGCRVRGPLSFDVAFDPAAGVKKKVHDVEDADAGVADVLLFPNLLSGNLTVKAIMYTADCRFGGVLCGVACPVVFMSRADTAATRLNSLALALGALAEAHGAQKTGEAPGQEMKP